ncbi:hypothetical protein HY500_03520 [Candidatus Woesearchaeota archaeon]|nr:hypothetical protein [Candidatus Woesearchaeota archaeon]
MQHTMLLQKDKTLFCDLLGYSPESKIVEYLLEIREDRFTFNDVVIAVGLNRKRAYAILRNHLKIGLIEKGEKVKQIQFHKLNKKDERVKLLSKLFDKIIKD